MRATAARVMLTLFSICNSRSWDKCCNYRLPLRLTGLLTVHGLRCFHTSVVSQATQHIPHLQGTSPAQWGDKLVFLTPPPSMDPPSCENGSSEPHSETV